ncbi:hypothetical protein EDD16DRAFT_1691831 [Pisolithus croceorrhizus]|nr:hypothetical protein EDD16DRAFT_1691831 [Pisolithus croceorrhizus]
MPSVVVGRHPFQLPIIDIAPYLDPVRSNSPERAAVSKALHEACVRYGFFYLDISKYVNAGEPEELTRLAREFFFLPQEEKDKISITLQDNCPRNPDKSKTLWGENQWPTIPAFREKYEQWIEKMKKLGMIVMEAMANGLGLSEDEWKELRSQVDNSFWIVRAIGYPPLPDDYDGFSCGAHNLLYADPTRSALQVFLHNSGTPCHRDGKEGVWINADPIPGCIVCNIGSMWEVWSNGLYKSTLHRVIHKGSNYRIPFFFEPNFDAIVEPLTAAMEQTGNVQVYKPVEYSNFLLSKVSYNFSLETM